MAPRRDAFADAGSGHARADAGLGCRAAPAARVPALAALSQPAVANRDLGLFRRADHVARRVVHLDPFDRVVPAREDRREVPGAAARNPSAPRPLLCAAPARHRDLCAQRRRDGELQRACGAPGDRIPHGAADLSVVRARAGPAIRGALRARSPGPDPALDRGPDPAPRRASPRPRGSPRPRWAGSSAWASDVCSSPRPRC